MPKKLRLWTADEMNLFLDAPLRVLNLTRRFFGFSISAQTGMRMGKVLGMRWSDIDFEGKRIFIRRTLSKIDEDSVYGFVNEGKTNGSL
ncbi:tyrosine-type recombinase/integrase [Bacillus rugosus]|uniref:tyrosine-type recombinase/integrase n=1 Tax=Bacillus rugosus TaxID=2715209 RepID=UPI0014218D67|nr:tyrosine-type recombinase/integrase [Bacillus rugosus]NUF04884.1 tyrosine-type recombinase/integrase [Bacillus rugosus]